MGYKSVLVGLILTLLVGPVGAGILDDFEDIGQLTDHLISGGPGIDGIPAMTNPQIVNPNQIQVRPEAVIADHASGHGQEPFFFEIHVTEFEHVGLISIQCLL